MVALYGCTIIYLISPLEVACRGCFPFFIIVEIFLMSIFLAESLFTPY